MLRVAAADPASAEALALIAQLDAALLAITGDSGASSFDPRDVIGEGTAFVIAYDEQGEALGCGALRSIEGDVAELKRMYARPGSGAGAVILAELERRAAAFGYRRLWLSTRRVNARAVSFYERHGYSPVPPYGRYIGRDTGRNASVCLGRELV
ncbi:GNAT family N-acetyltransferase [Massilia sp.]|uniref:GNAT family N-acetyltransferase n=1 Tax=Massilia sp. TaxID=1882437 RepID=UPI00289E2258|nr:GNAT family N-acetyltransferase [Massilia sp.]